MKKNNGIEFKNYQYAFMDPTLSPKHSLPNFLILDQMVSKQFQVYIEKT